MFGILSVLKLDKSKVPLQNNIRNWPAFFKMSFKVILIAITSILNVNLVCLVFGTSSWLVGRRSLASSLIMVAVSLSTIPWTLRLIWAAPSASSRIDLLAISFLSLSLWVRTLEVRTVFFGFVSPCWRFLLWHFFWKFVYLFITHLVVKFKLKGWNANSAPKSKAIIFQKLWLILYRSNRMTGSTWKHIGFPQNWINRALQFFLYTPTVAILRSMLQWWNITKI